MKYAAFIVLLLIGLVGIIGIVDASWNASANITLTTGSTTGKYPMYINVSNATGVSTTTLIYTNGTTKSDWSDIQFVNASGTEIPHWLETSSATATTVRVWYAPSTIAAGGYVKMNFGDANASYTSDGYNTFYPNLFDDFAGSSINTSLWTGSATSVSGGIATISGGGGIRSLVKYGTGYEYVTLTRLNGITGGKWGAIGFGDPFDTDQAIQYAYGAGSLFYTQTATGGNANGFTTTTANSNYHIFQGRRNGTTSFITSDNFGGVFTSALYVSTVSQNISLDSRNADGGEVYTNWIAVRPYQFPEPSVTGITIEYPVEEEPTPTPTTATVSRVYSNSAMPLVFGIGAMLGVVGIAAVLMAGRR